MSFQPDIERKSQQEIRIFQERKMLETIAYVASQSTFYRSHFQRHSIDPASVTSLDDLSRIPPTTKLDLQQYNWEFLCVAKEEIAEYTSTSGTLGKPVTIALTQSDLERLAYNEAISFACAHASSLDIFQLMLTLDRQFMAGIAYYQGIRKLGASVVRVGPGVPAMQWDAIQRLRPTILVAVPSFLLKLIEYAQQHGIDPNRSSVKGAICIGESLRTVNFEPGVIARRIQEKWRIQLYNTYASTEMQTAFTECEHGKGGHHHPELVIVEILDEMDQPVQNGQPGEVTITTLGVQGMPLLRYKTGDVAIAYSDKCACGRTSLRLGPVLGRKQQLIKLKGTTIYPSGIFEILNETEIHDYVVEAFTGPLDTDELRIHIALNGEDTKSAERKLNTIFQSRLRVVPEISFVSLQQLEQLQFGKGERKMRRFVDSRKTGYGVG